MVPAVHVLMYARSRRRVRRYDHGRADNESDDFVKPPCTLRRGAPERAEEADYHGDNGLICSTGVYLGIRITLLLVLIKASSGRFESVNPRTLIPVPQKKSMHETRKCDNVSRRPEGGVFVAQCYFNTYLRKSPNRIRAEKSIYMPW